MTNLKIFFVLFVLIISCNSVYSQNYKFKTSGFSVVSKNEKGKWGTWSDVKPVSILVTFDTNKSRIVIYSEIIQLFEIIEYEPTNENDTDLVYSFTCKDNLGIDCTVSIITRKKQENRKQLYINYNDRIVVYNIFNM